MKRFLGKFNELFQHGVIFYGVAAVLLITAMMNYVLSQQSVAAKKTYDLTDRSPNNSLKLTTSIVGSWAMPSGYGGAQSFAINGSHYIVIATPSGGNDNNTGYNKILLIDRSSKKNVSSSYSNPQHKVGHGNGATWDSEAEELLVVHNTNVYRFNSKYKYIGTKSTLNASGTALSASGIAYDNLNKQYWTSAGGVIRKINKSSWAASNIVETTHDQVNQDLGYYHGFVYRPLWEAKGSYTSNGKTYSGKYSKNDGVLFQFADDGTFTGSFYTHSPSCELESVAFAGSTPDMYLLFNNCKNGVHDTTNPRYFTIAKVSDAAQLKKMYHRFTVKYDANGGSGAPKSYTTHVGIKSTLSSAKPTREYYDFLGWSTNKAATAKQYAAGAKFIRKTSTINTSKAAVTEPDVTLYAVWKEQSYTVNYNANGGSGAPESQTLGRTKDATIPSKVPTRTNYKFLGWSKNKNATAADYHPSGKYTERTTVTLYAVWQAETYRVSYNANGGSGAPSAQTANVTSNIAISTTKPTRTYYDFLGWSTTAGGKAEYQPGDTYTGRSNITLYAVWSVQYYTITFNANGGSNAPTAIKKAKTVASVVIPTTKPIRSGFIFRGWAESASATKAEYIVGDNYTKRSNVTLYAVWEASAPVPDLVEVIYDANGGSGAPASTSGTTGSIVLTDKTPTRDGYKFLGWAESETATVAKYQPGDKVAFTKDTVLYAVWVKSTITLSYDANGGSGAPASHSGAVGEIRISTVVPTRSGYSFDGWSVDPDESVSYRPGDLYRGTVSRKLYAVWSEQTVKIHYKLRGGTSAPTEQAVATRRRVTLPTSRPTRKAHYFRGWSLDEEAHSVDYDPGDTIYVSTSDITLYAVWGAAYYVISFDVNGGSDDKFDDLIGMGSDVTIYKDEPTWAGYSFKGWDEDPEATTAEYQAGDEIGSETNLTLYAVWERNEDEIYDGTDNNPIDDYDADIEDRPAQNPKTEDVNIYDYMPMTAFAFIIAGTLVSRFGRRR